eukprot:TRINITY_DN3784_c0_g3_i6.p2 TRINITY_DN3784_c0_g3~~TRINITY_DN3784_c0_g3_i6.p2  ORF type:complete len:102 (+),score=0.28 TRINITY_DN3784_c0_g3_i6:123-428(+)
MQQADAYWDSTPWTLLTVLLSPYLRLRAPHTREMMEESRRFIIIKEDGVTVHIKLLWYGTSQPTSALRITLHLHLDQKVQTSTCLSQYMDIHCIFFHQDQT